MNQIEKIMEMVKALDSYEERVDLFHGIREFLLQEKRAIRYSHPPTSGVIFRIGDRVHVKQHGKCKGFDGVVLRINRCTVAVREDATAQEWRVSPGLLEPKHGETRKPLDPEIQKAFARLCNRLSPENLTCDGERSQQEVKAEAAAIKREWAKLENKVGRTVSVEEIQDVSKE